MVHGPGGSLAKLRTGVHACNVGASGLPLRTKVEVAVGVVNAQALIDVKPVEGA